MFTKDRNNTVRVNKILYWQIVFQISHLKITLIYLTADMLNDLNGTVAIQIRGIQSKGTFE